MSLYEIQREINRVQGLINDFNKLLEKVGALAGGLLNVCKTLDLASEGYKTSFMLSNVSVDRGATEKLSIEIEQDSRKLSGPVSSEIIVEINRLNIELENLRTAYAREQVRIAEESRRLAERARQSNEYNLPSSYR